MLLCVKLGLQYTRECSQYTLRSCRTTTQRLRTVLRVYAQTCDFAMHRHLGWSWNRSVYLQPCLFGPGGSAVCRLGHHSGFLVNLFSSPTFWSKSYWPHYVVSGLNIWIGSPHFSVHILSCSLFVNCPARNRRLSILCWCVLRPAGGVKHSDSDLVETRMLSAKKALRWIEGSILSNSRKF